MIALAVALALAWLLQQLISDWLESARLPAAIVGTIQNPPGQIGVSLDNGTQETEAHADHGWFRFDGVTPGQHLLEYSYTGYRPRSARVDVSGGRDNYFSLPALISEEDSRPDFHGIFSNTLRPVLVENFSTSGEDPTVGGDILNGIPHGWTSAHHDGTGWIYLGTAQGNQLFGATIDALSVPSAGETVYVSNSVFLRDDRPYRRVFSYRLGDDVGVVDAGSAVSVIAIEEVGDGRYWAHVALE